MLSLVTLICAFAAGLVAVYVTSHHQRPAALRIVGNELVNRKGTPFRLLGVDVTGTEDACVLDKGFSWGPGALSATEAASIAAWHANAVRVPLNEDCWLGINGVPAQYSGAAYQTAIKQWVANLNAAGLVAILDLHWSAPGNTEALQQWPMADADHSITFWSQVAATFKGDPSVIFDLFNEPYAGQSHPTAANWSCWLNGCTATFQLCTHAITVSNCSPVTYQAAGMQQLLDAVRDAGARQPVMIGGLNWAGDPCGLQDSGGNGGACTWLSYEPHDPDHQLIASFHTYDWTACSTQTCWDDDVLPLARSVPVVTGEFGEQDCSASYDTSYMDWADQHDISYLAWAWQADTDPSNCSNSDLYLISDWDGTANVPAGHAIRAHLARLMRGGAARP